MPAYRLAAQAPGDRLYTDLLSSGFRFPDGITNPLKRMQNGILWLVVGVLILLRMWAS